MPPPAPRSILLAPLTAAGLAVGSPALPPWVDAGDVPLPGDAASAAANKSETPIQSEPSASSRRRGTAAAHARLPVFGARRGPGCPGRWLMVGPLAWVCQDGVRLGPEPPVPADDRSLVAAADGLPFRYFFVGRDGSAGYRNLQDADLVAPDQELQPGFALAVIDERARGGERFARTHHGLWVPMRDLGPVHPFGFRGERVEDGRLDFGWIADDRVSVHARPAIGARTSRTRVKFEKVGILEVRTAQRETWLRVGDGEWLRGRDVQRPTAAAPPDETRAGERWIDIDLASQTLVAWQGDRPVFATLVSTGKGAQGTETATPKGVHRVWVKLRSSNMDNLEDEDASRYYAIEDVPWVQYFSKGVGLHGAFWHHGFGHVRSHGCVNLTPLDAQWLFEWTSPRLPAGWSAILPSEIDRGTVVRVR